MAYAGKDNSKDNSKDGTKDSSSDKTGKETKDYTEKTSDTFSIDPIHNAPRLLEDDLLENPLNPYPHPIRNPCSIFSF